MIFARCESEATVFYEELLPEADPQDYNILRQALAGMIWSKQFFHYDVARWLDGDSLPPPEGHKHGRNRSWRHMKAAHVISMPDTWEYPWFAAWDLAFHCAVLALVDVDFAKDQIELLLKETYLHPNGQIPAYEWAFGDVNPPVLAMAALKTFRAERVQRGKGDIGFLQRVTHKLLMNYTWWLNRKDADGANVFEGGFLGLDNISVYDRSPAAARRLQPEAGGRDRMDGDVRAQHDGDVSRARRLPVRLRGRGDPVLHAVPRHRQHHRRRQRHGASRCGTTPTASSRTWWWGQTAPLSASTCSPSSG